MLGWISTVVRLEFEFWAPDSGRCERARLTASKALGNRIQFSIEVLIGCGSDWSDPTGVTKNDLTRVTKNDLTRVNPTRMIFH